MVRLASPLEYQWFAHIGLDKPGSGKGGGSGSHLMPGTGLWPLHHKGGWGRGLVFRIGLWNPRPRDTCSQLPTKWR